LNFKRLILIKKIIKILLLIITFSTIGISQNSQRKLALFEPSDTLHHTRFKWALGVSATTYTVFSVSLYNTWYKKFDQEPFHFFDDWNEWENMDKYGHFYTSYFQGVLCYKGARWTGLSENKSIVTGLICGALFQTTIEVMDGFSSKWGWSWSDFALNNGGLGAFYVQQKYWGEQRITFKVSSLPYSHSNDLISSVSGTSTTTLNERADELFGSTWAERYLKDYNAQIYWASINISSFTGPDTKIPKWLNLAIGYGANNMYGGFENEWELDGESFVLDNSYDRYKQFYLGFDVDLTRIKVKNHFLKSLFSTLNIFKAPLPAIEINTKGEFTFHLFAR